MKGIVVCFVVVMFSIFSNQVKARRGSDSDDDPEEPTENATEKRDTPYCECTYHAGGCVISASAPQGWKCKCSYKGAWTCGGVAFPCSDSEYCPGGRVDYCACKQGGGECSAYYRTSTKCDEYNAARPDSTKPGAGTITYTCACTYHPGGCTISTPAPEGTTCRCLYKGAWTCAGWAEGCFSDTPNPADAQYCPAGDYSYCGCMRGGGECGAYPEAGTSKLCDFSKPAGKQCDCNKNSEWTTGKFVVKDIIYSTTGIIKGNPRPVTVGNALDIPNASTAAQSQKFVATRTLSTKNTFQYSYGIELSVGMTFKVGVPLIAAGETSIGVTHKNTFTWGKETTTTTQYSHSFICNSPPKTYTRCQAYLTMFDVQVPYTMRLENTEIENCECTSSGIWKGVSAYNSRLSADKVSDCQDLDSLGGCVNNK